MAQSSPPPTSPAITVRPATVDDSSPLAEIHVRSWQEAYQGILTADFLASLSIPDRVAFWETRLSSLEQNEAVLVAEVGAILAGFVLLGPARDKSGDGEVLAIYLDPDRWRQGIGSTLMAAAQERLASHGFG
ncbi:MAG: GNAT family N-acetyltransferase, partial [Actinomycetota bacterium]